jgi:hypothetical protein
MSSGPGGVLIFLYGIGGAFHALTKGNEIGCKKDFTISGSGSPPRRSSGSRLSVKSNASTI